MSSSSDLQAELNKVIANSAKFAISRSKKEIKSLLNTTQYTYTQKLAVLYAALGVAHSVNKPSVSDPFGHSFKCTGPFGVDTSVLDIDWKAVAGECSSTLKKTETKKRKR